MKIKSLLPVALTALLTVGTTQTCQAAVVTSFQSLNIRGTLYDATIHDAGLSFNQIWDVDNDAQFAESDASLVNHTPFFFSDFGAFDAASAVLAAFGTSNTHDGTRDGFFIPIGYSTGTFTFNHVEVRYDSSASIGVDNLRITSYRYELPIDASNRWVSFELAATTNIPLPPTIFMLIPSLLALSRFRKNVIN